VPTNFGQGYGGMIYLPTVNYVMPDHTAASPDQGLFRDLLVAHEVAHQWWGNVVTTGSYHHEWLMEALANYSAMMYLETKTGPKSLETALDFYRQQLFIKGPDGETPESEGPVVQGRRLEGSNNPSAAQAVMYGKGSWVIHMLRRRLGTEQFLKALAETRRRYEWKPLDTEDFRLLCAEFLPPGSNDAKLENFFDQWVYGTGVPSLKLTYSVKGKPGAYKLNGVITQSDVPDDFSVAVPVEIQTGRGKAAIQQVRTASEPVSFTVNVATANTKAVLDPGWSVLRR
jgi:aminopeptidase N